MAIKSLLYQYVIRLFQFVTWLAHALHNRHCTLWGERRHLGRLDVKGYLTLPNHFLQNKECSGHV